MNNSNADTKVEKTHQLQVQSWKSKNLRLYLKLLTFWHPAFSLSEYICRHLLRCIK